MNLPDDKLPVRALILDRELIQRVYSARTAHGNSPHDEVWDGTLILYALPDNEHQQLRSTLAVLFAEIAPNAVLPGANVSDRDADWMENYREPDVVVYLASNPAKDSNTHWVGGPDVAVEIVSPSEDPRLKLDFYAKIKTREVLIVDRDPWAVELYQLQGGKLVLLGTSSLPTSVVLTSAALPLSFQLQPGTLRPTILITHTATRPNLDRVILLSFRLL
ncbi:MAG: Uma2 family endonuclease [Planctomycetia bacterium]|nr:Uma2 family endonuclease [Planctomycetia bacterium]